MGDLRTFWPDPAMGESEGNLGGDLVTARGGDPLIEGNPETPNSVSGLPTLPSRWTPNETPPEPPSLEDRNPGTIDQR